MLAGDGGESLGESGRGAMPCSAPAAGSGMLSAVNDGAEITFPVMKSDGSGGRKKKTERKKETPPVALKSQLSPPWVWSTCSP